MRPPNHQQSIVSYAGTLACRERGIAADSGCSEPGFLGSSPDGARDIATTIHCSQSKRGGGASVLVKVIDLCEHSVDLATVRSLMVKTHDGRVGCPPEALADVALPAPEKNSPEPERCGVRPELEDIERELKDLE